MVKNRFLYRQISVPFSCGADRRQLQSGKTEIIVRVMNRCSKGNELFPLMKINFLPYENFIAQGRKFYSIKEKIYTIFKEICS